MKQKKNQKGLSKPEVTQLKQRLLSRLQQLKGNVSKLSDQSVGKNPNDSSGNISTTPIHMADIGTDAFEHEMTLGLVEEEADELEEIEEAIERLKKGSYGLCESCKRPIPKQRLIAIPYTRMCVNCKKKEEGV
jgi:RNA polymerase-binding transcription factor DksA